ncbi:CDP-diacylglycerol--glycerol-3-phosphate 3-phosphatidyltransferase [Prochlorococcus sp. SS52]|nr:CDP-diacylglycerol--glycerol-3-phosphate 3-phosphatidyltransferase [Prochlorococcus marinus str. LG]KGG35155.1 CDP-diacylglycerol--glycerol-3-phosphate 3-phosphatidyltransferase [Prochlorococcus sp. SS52]
MFIGVPILIALSIDQILVAWILLLLGAFSDWMDGWLARKAGGGSKLGAQLDPLADKIMLLAPIIWLAKNNVIPLWSVWLLISRELVVTAWRSNDRRGGPASILGKIKTSLLFSSVILLTPISFVNYNLSTSLHVIGIIFFWVSLFIAILSSYNYVNNQLS